MFVTLSIRLIKDRHTPKDYAATTLARLNRPIADKSNRMLLPRLANSVLSSSVSQCISISGQPTAALLLFPALVWPSPQTCTSFAPNATCWLWSRSCRHPELTVYLLHFPPVALFCDTDSEAWVATFTSFILRIGVTTCDLSSGHQVLLARTKQQQINWLPCTPYKIIHYPHSVFLIPLWSAFSNNPICNLIKGSLDMNENRKARNRISESENNFLQCWPIMLDCALDACRSAWRRNVSAQMQSRYPLVLVWWQFSLKSTVSQLITFVFLFVWNSKIFLCQPQDFSSCVFWQLKKLFSLNFFPNSNWIMFFVP